LYTCSQNPPEICMLLNGEIVCLNRKAPPRGRIEFYGKNINRPKGVKSTLGVKIST